MPGVIALLDDVDSARVEALWDEMERRFGVPKGDPGGLVRVLRRLGFDERQEGSHRIFTHPSAPRALTLQPVERLAKEYQVKQVRRAILESRLVESDE